MTSRVVVLGAGFLGWEIATSLAAQGRGVTVVTRSPRTDRTAHEGITLEYADVGATESLDRLCHLVSQTDAVVYAVGALYPAETAMRPWLDLYTSLPPFLATLEALIRAPGPRMVFLSSGGTVYGDQGAGPLSEQTPRSPSSSYGISKLAAELYLADHCRRFGTLGTSLRVANAYGPGQRTERGQGAVAAFLSAAQTGRAVPFYGGGTPVRDYVHVGDVASAVALLLDAPRMPPALNIGTGIGTSLRQLLTAVEDASGTQVPVQPLPARDIDLAINVLDPSLAVDTLGWMPRSLADGLAQTWAELIRQPGDGATPDA